MSATPRQQQGYCQPVVLGLGLRKSMVGHVSIHTPQRSVLLDQFHYPLKTSVITSSISCIIQGLSRYVYLISFTFYIFFILTPLIKHCWYAENHQIHFLTMVLLQILNVRSKFKIKTFLHNSTYNCTLLSISDTMQVAADNRSICNSIR